MSQLIPNKSSFVAIGAWNTAIIQPNWLRREFPTLVPKEFDILFLPGISRLLRFDIKNIFLEPSESSLVFIPKKIDDDTLDFISKLSIGIKKKLPFTPVISAGINFCFKLDENENFNIKDIDNIDESKQIYEQVDLKEIVGKETRHTFSFSNYQLNIIYKINGNSKSIQYNYHYDRDAPIESISKSLKGHYKSSLELNNNLIGGS